MIVKVKNNLDTMVPYTYTSHPESSGGTTVRVKNINSFQASWAIQIGATGNEQTEIKVLGTAVPSGTALNTSAALTYDHPADTPVYAIKYDQIVFQRATAGTTGTATAMTNGTVSITPDHEYTQFDDTSGAATYGYRSVFRNSVTGSVTTQSDWLTSSGFNWYSLAKIRNRAKAKLFSANFIKTDDDIDDWINEWLETMNNTAIDVNEDYSIGTATVAYSGTAELGTIGATDFKELRRVWFTTDGTDYYKAGKIDQTDFLPDQTFNETTPYYYWQGDLILGRKPADQAGTALIHYYKQFTVLDDDTDELPNVMKPYTKSFVDYVLAQAYYFDNNKDLGDRFMSSANNELKRFKKDISPRSHTGPQSIKITEVVSAEEYDYI